MKEQFRSLGKVNLLERFEVCLEHKALLRGAAKSDFRSASAGSAPVLRYCVDSGGHHLSPVPLGGKFPLHREEPGGRRHG
jgi:hypothetical protein